MSGCGRERPARFSVFDMRNGHFHFVKAFFRNPAAVGAIWPSSEELARAMIAGLHLAPGETLLELGPGTGAFTRHIQNILPDKQAYLGIERETTFVKLLRRSYPELHFVNGDARETPILVTRAHRKPVKVVVSSLPFATLLREDREGIIAGLLDIMPPGAVFRTFQYVHAYPLPSAVHFRRQMHRAFEEFHRSSIVFQNIPPAFVLTWIR
ncbi:MAG: hypothetical protein D6681_09325 [Calditrichaeota bacterium]|nr:MAG: hypothetical protein D6681_09325 [Calditrichota bacterium]